MSELAILKFAVQAVLVETEDGKVVGEHLAETVVIYGGPEGLVTYANGFQDDLDKLNAERAAGAESSAL